MLKAFLLLIVVLFASCLPQLPVHCGPEHLPSIYSEQIANDLARSLTSSADFLSKNSKENRTYLLKVIETGTLLQLSFEERVGHVASTFADMNNSEVDANSLFTAEFETIRIEQWTRKLKLIGLRPAEILQEVMDVPLQQMDLWKGTDLTGKRELLLRTIRNRLCRVDFNMGRK